MKSIHKWPSEKAMNVTAKYGLRKFYQWAGENTVREAVRKELKKSR